MKITVIASNEEVLNKLKSTLEKKSNSDEITYLKRFNNTLDLSKVDLDSESILIIDSLNVESSDLSLISEITINRIKPAVFYLCQSYTEDQLINLMRAGVSEVLVYPHADQDKRISEAIERVRQRHGVAKPMKMRAKVLSFISCKGGAGASFVAGNVGFALADKMQQKVLLIDLHAQYGDIAFQLSNIPIADTLADVAKESYLDSMMIVSASIKVTNNFFILQSPDHPAKSEGLLPKHINNLISVAGQDYDYIIFDLPNTLDRNVMEALDLSTNVFVVSNPTISYLKALTRMIELFDELSYAAGKVNIVLNRLGHVGGLDQRKVEDVIGRPIQYFIEEDALHVVESISIGSPILKSFPEILVSKSILEMTSIIYGAKAKFEKKSFLTSLFSK